MPALMAGNMPSVGRIDFARADSSSA
jgi:hypothetical protein